MSTQKPRRPGPKKNSVALAVDEAIAAAPLALLEHVVDRARAFAAAARSPRTRIEYAKHWRAFEAWCAARALQALPCEPATLALYLTDRATTGLRPSSLGVAVAAIGERHRAAGVKHADLPHRNAHVAEIFRGIRRSLGTAPRQAAPVAIDELRAMSETLNDDKLIDVRDRALLVVGFAGAFRRSELAGLDVGDVAFGKAGVVITLRRSKTDQEGAGVTVGLPYGGDPKTCPVRTLKAWIEASRLEQGALFCSVTRHSRVGARISGRDVARVVQKLAAATGLDAARYSGHSLRSGLATAAAAAGKSDRSIMLQGRWAGRAMVDRYVRDARLLDARNAASGIGL